ncbi:hypothetical protein HK183_02390, partial [Streptococcus agalactiae]|nr:hypothetical protein [Streptococcus agalactiae]
MFGPDETKSNRLQEV